MRVTAAYTVITSLSPVSRGKFRHWLPDLGFLTVVKAILLGNDPLLIRDLFLRLVGALQASGQHWNTGHD
jgi:hypothetical protein